jgi:hypothetical protein
MREIGTLYRMNGEVLEVHPMNGKKFSLKELQTYVGGSIELVPGTSRKGNPAAWCNEEGKLNDLRPNREATRVFMIGVWSQDTLVGNVIQVRKEKP